MNSTDLSAPGRAMPTPGVCVPRFGLIIVGDEILSGKRQDKHMAQVIRLLGERGLSLSWARYLGDDRAELTECLSATLASDDVVFSCGGIGATPDDHTRQAAAQALGQPLVLHPEAQRLITERTAEMAREGKAASADMSLPENRQRLRMGEFPQGASLIPNPYNRIPGFRCASHWFVPGFPVMAWPMIAWVLDSHYAQFFHQVPVADRSARVLELAESTITPLMEDVGRRWAQVKVYSLPSVGEGGQRRHIELGVKGPPEAAEAAFEALMAGVKALGGQIETNPRADQ
jgi:molybdopterin-biosynthesis enzyme MoeA-like protein